MPRPLTICHSKPINALHRRFLLHEIIGAMAAGMEVAVEMSFHTFRAPVGGTSKAHIGRSKVKTSSRLMPNSGLLDVHVVDTPMS